MNKKIIIKLCKGRVQEVYSKFEKVILVSRARLIFLKLLSVTLGDAYSKVNLFLNKIKIKIQHFEINVHKIQYIIIKKCKLP